MMKRCKQQSYIFRIFLLVMILIQPIQIASHLIGGTRNMMMNQTVQRRALPGEYQRVSFSKASREELAEIQKAANFALDQLQHQPDAHPPEYTFLNLVRNNDKVFGKAVRAFEQVVEGLNWNLVVAIQRNNGEDMLTVENCVGAFAVAVYDHFGTISITAWAKETTCEKAVAWSKSEDDFSNEDEDGE